MRKLSSKSNILNISYLMAILGAFYPHQPIDEDNESKDGFLCISVVLCSFPKIPEIAIHLESTTTYMYVTLKMHWSP